MSADVTWGGRKKDPARLKILLKERTRRRGRNRKETEGPGESGESCLLQQRRSLSRWCKV